MNEKTAVKHTPTPWETSAGGEIVREVQPGSVIVESVEIYTNYITGHLYGDPKAVANADFIVCAVNSFEILLSACQFALSDPEYDKDMKLKALEDAIAKAEAK